MVTGANTNPFFKNLSHPDFSFNHMQLNLRQDEQEPEQQTVAGAELSGQFAGVR